MPPDNDIGKLLPVWPVQPMKGPGEGQEHKTVVQREPEKRRRSPKKRRSKYTVDEDGHIDFYA